MAGGPLSTQQALFYLVAECWSSVKTGLHSSTNTTAFPDLQPSPAPASTAQRSLGVPGPGAADLATPRLGTGLATFGLAGLRPDATVLGTTSPAPSAPSCSAPDIVIAHSNLVAALMVAKAVVAIAREHERVAALAWEAGSTNRLSSIPMHVTMLRLRAIYLALPASTLSQNPKWLTTPPGARGCRHRQPPCLGDGYLEHPLSGCRHPRSDFLHLSMLVGPRPPHPTVLRPGRPRPHGHSVPHYPPPGVRRLVWSSLGSSGRLLLNYKISFASVVALLVRPRLPPRSSSSATARLKLSTSMSPSRFHLRGPLYH
jgi:hypothetical protein